MTNKKDSAARENYDREQERLTIAIEELAHNSEANRDYLDAAV